MTVESRLNILKSKLNESLDKITKAENSVKRAEKKLENAQYDRDCFIHEIDHEIINSWNGKIDWNILLEDTELHSTFMYEYTNRLLEEMDVTAFASNIYTKQRSINVSFQTTGASELSRKVDALEFLSQYIIPHNGTKSFPINNTKEDDCAYALVIDSGGEEDTAIYKVDRMTWGSVDQSHLFPTLVDALKYVQFHLCDTALAAGHDYLEISQFEDDI